MTTLGSCPKCHFDGSDAIKYNAEKVIFRCWNCGLEYGQEKAFPYHYFRVHKNRTKSVANKALIAKKAIVKNQNILI